MAITNPLYLNGWVNDITVIDANEVKAEFMNLYGAINGGLDSSNFQNGSVTTAKLQDGSVTDSKISSMSASKLTGVINSAQLPSNLMTTTGGGITGTITFNNTDLTPFIRSFENDEVVFMEIGTGATKVTFSVNPSGNLFQIKRGSTVMFAITNDGTVLPTKLRVPVI